MIYLCIYLPQEKWFSSSQAVEWPEGNHHPSPLCTISSPAGRIQHPAVWSSMGSFWKDITTRRGWLHTPAQMLWRCFFRDQEADLHVQRKPRKTLFQTVAQIWYYPASSHLMGIWWRLKFDEYRNCACSDRWQFFTSSQEGLPTDGQCSEWMSNLGWYFQSCSCLFNPY